MQPQPRFGHRQKQREVIRIFYYPNIAGDKPRNEREHFARFKAIEMPDEVAKSCGYKLVNNQVVSHELGLQLEKLITDATPAPTDQKGGK